ncbi:ubiquitin-like protein [Linderina pennispora]|uniref:Ubiquitin-like protein n=1 Tax=Linderina pennispora TaxID=61395 RepID=A0A1Y1W929_9FUNG|nr:ubiquitin-like protein [Linderina pennispora]KAJ1957200.1 SUMO protein smt3 [Linderina pennispora]ORX70037.1 ubiquitin-like protein [Linderina pennispora]
MPDDASNPPAASEAKPDLKPDATSEDHVNLKVVGPDGSEVMFKIKRKTKLSKLMQAYCSRSGQTLGSVRFLVDGQRITGDNTPEELDLEDGDSIDAMMEQIGGSL